MVTQNDFWKCRCKTDNIHSCVENACPACSCTIEHGQMANATEIRNHIFTVPESLREVYKSVASPNILWGL